MEVAGVDYSVTLTGDALSFADWKERRARSLSVVSILAWFGFFTLGMISLGVSVELTNSSIPSFLAIALAVTGYRLHVIQSEKNAYAKYCESFPDILLEIGQDGLAFVSGRIRESYQWEDVTLMEITPEAVKFELNSGRHIHLTGSAFDSEGSGRKFVQYLEARISMPIAGNG